MLTLSQRTLCLCVAHQGKAESNMQNWLTDTASNLQVRWRTRTLLIVSAVVLFAAGDLLSLGVAEHCLFPFALILTGGLEMGFSYYSGTAVTFGNRPLFSGTPRFYVQQCIHLALALGGIIKLTGLR